MDRNNESPPAHKSNRSPSDEPESTAQPENLPFIGAHNGVALPAYSEEVVRNDGITVEDVSSPPVRSSAFPFSTNADFSLQYHDVPFYSNGQSTSAHNEDSNIYWTGLLSGGNAETVSDGTLSQHGNELPNRCPTRRAWHQQTEEANPSEASAEPSLEDADAEFKYFFPDYQIPKKRFCDQDVKTDHGQPSQPGPNQDQPVPNTPKIVSAVEPDRNQAANPSPFQVSNPADGTAHHQQPVFGPRGRPAIRDPPSRPSSQLPRESVQQPGPGTEQPVMYMPVDGVLRPVYYRDILHPVQPDDGHPRPRFLYPVAVAGQVPRRPQEGAAREAQPFGVLISVEPRQIRDGEVVDDRDEVDDHPIMRPRNNPK